MYMHTCTVLCMCSCRCMYGGHCNIHDCVHVHVQGVHNIHTVCLIFPIQCCVYEGAMHDMIHGQYEMFAHVQAHDMYVYTY